MKITTVVALALALSLSFVAGRAGTSESADAAGPSNKAVLKQVQKANRSLSALKEQLGLVYSQTNRNLSVVNNQVSTLKLTLGRPYVPRTVLGWLFQVCGNTGGGCY